MAEVYEDFAGAYVPDVLAFSLDLPIEDALNSEGGGIEEDCADGTNGLGTEAVEDAEAEVMRVVGEEDVVCVEVGECGFKAEEGAIAEVMRGISEGTGGDHERGFRGLRSTSAGTREQGAVQTLVSSTSGTGISTGRSPELARSW